MPVYFHANLTRYFKRLDSTVNGISKTFLKDKFGVWYAEQVSKQVGSAGIYSVDVKLKLSVLKPIHARWLISLYDHLRGQVDLIQKGFEKAGINDALNVAFEQEDPFFDLL